MFKKMILLSSLAGLAACGGSKSSDPSAPASPFAQFDALKSSNSKAFVAAMGSSGQTGKKSSTTPSSFGMMSYNNGVMTFSAPEPFADGDTAEEWNVRGRADSNIKSNGDILIYGNFCLTTGTDCSAIDTALKNGTKVSTHGYNNTTGRYEKHDVSAGKAGKSMYIKVSAEDKLDNTEAGKLINNTEYDAYRFRITSSEDRDKALDDKTKKLNKDLAAIDADSSITNKEAKKAALIKEYKNSTGGNTSKMFAIGDYGSTPNSVMVSPESGEQYVYVLNSKANAYDKYVSIQHFYDVLYQDNKARLGGMAGSIVKGTRTTDISKVGTSYTKTDGYVSFGILDDTLQLYKSVGDVSISISNDKKITAFNINNIEHYRAKTAHLNQGFDGATVPTGSFASLSKASGVGNVSINTDGSFAVILESNDWKGKASGGFFGPNADYIAGAISVQDTKSAGAKSTQGSFVGKK